MQPLSSFLPLRAFVSYVTKSGYSSSCLPFDPPFLPSRRATDKSEDLDVADDAVVLREGVLEEADGAVEDTEEVSESIRRLTAAGREDPDGAVASLSSPVV